MSILPISGYITINRANDYASIAEHFYAGGKDNVQISLKDLQEEVYGMAPTNIKMSNFYGLVCREIVCNPDNLFFDPGDSGSGDAQTVDINIIPDGNWSLSANPSGFFASSNYTNNTVTIYPTTTGFRSGSYTLTFGNYVSATIDVEQGSLPPDPAGYGYLYNGYSYTHANFGPTNWSVPTPAQYETLASSLGGLNVAGGKMKETGTLHWESPNTSADNSSNFTAFGSGVRYKNDGHFAAFKRWCNLATNDWHISRYCNYDSAVFTLNEDDDVSPHRWGFAVRLIWTGSGPPMVTTIDDYDGNTYNIVQIGIQYWLKQNWKCTKLNDGTALIKITSPSTWAAASVPSSRFYCAMNNDDNNV